jgi:hypothetical protein
VFFGSYRKGKFRTFNIETEPSYAETHPKILQSLFLFKIKKKKYIAKITCGCFPTSTRIFTYKSEIFRHKTSHMVLSIIFLIFLTPIFRQLLVAVQIMLVDNMKYVFRKRVVTTYAYLVSMRNVNIFITTY